MARKTTREKGIPDGPRIPGPTHEPLEVRFCGSVYEFVMPSKMEAEILQGYRLAALGRMSAPVQELAYMASREIAESVDMERAAVAIAENMEDRERLMLAAGMYMAIAETFEFVCRCLNLSASVVAFAKENFETIELFNAFNILQGAFMRPFGGMPSGTAATRPRAKTASKKRGSGTPS